MAYKISGRALFIGPAMTMTSKSGNQYTKRDMVIAVRKFDPYTGHPSEESDNTPKFTFFGQQCQQLDAVRIDDIVVVHFDISGRSYEKDGKKEYFTEVRPFRVDPCRAVSANAVQPPGVDDNSNPYGLINPSALPKPADPDLSSPKLENDDLPF